MTDYLQQTGTGRVFVATPALKKRADMRPCDAPAVSTARQPADPGKPDISKMTKDQLEAFALKTFDVDIDKRKTVAELRDEVQALADKATEEAE